MNNKQKLEEFFSIPIGLEEVDNIFGFKVYSSDGLVKSFLKSIKSSGRGNPVYEPIEKLVKAKRIMPVYQIKGVLKFLKHKMIGNPEDKAIMGFYHMGIKRVYIMIDNNVSIFGHASNDDIASTTIHECQHLFADSNKAKFVSLFKDELKRYYISAFSRIFELKQIPKEVDKVILYISSFEGKNFNTIPKRLDGYEKVLRGLRPASSLTNEQFDQNINDIRRSIIMFTKYFDMFVRSYRNYKNIFGPLDRAYRDAFSKRNSYTSPYQELISVSEVICVLSEIKPSNPKIKKAFKVFS
jgi:hypothetical protein